MFKRPLRQRVAVTCGLIGFVLSLCFAIVTTVVAEEYEHILIQAMLDGQARAVIDRLRADPSATLANSERFAGYREQDAPEPFRGLPNGLHEVDIDGHDGLHAAVYGEAGNRWIFVIEVGRIEVLERYLTNTMIAIVIGGTLLSGWLGWMLANQAIRPVVRLADAVKRLPARPIATNMATEFGAEDEIGHLAGAIDAYQERLVEVDVSEKTFFGNASHELRTPIAVIQGAVEVLCDDPTLTPPQLGRIGRIDRAVMELGSLLEALLLSARGVPAEGEELDIGMTVSEALSRIASVEPEAPRRIFVVAKQPLKVVAPRRWANCIFSVLIQRILTKAPGTSWNVVITSAGLDLVQPDREIGPGERVQRSDLGLNLMFVDRLCRGLGWHLEQEVSEQGGLTLRMRIH